MVSQSNYNYVICVTKPLFLFSLFCCSSHRCDSRMRLTRGSAPGSHRFRKCSQSERLKVMHGTSKHVLTPGICSRKSVINPIVIQDTTAPAARPPTSSKSEAQFEDGASQGGARFCHCPAMAYDCPGFTFSLAIWATQCANPALLHIWDRYFETRAVCYVLCLCLRRTTDEVMPKTSCSM